MVLLKTTGGGRFRFNPNLYHCGKVEGCTRARGAARVCLCSRRAAPHLVEGCFGPPELRASAHRWEAFL